MTEEVLNHLQEQEEAAFATATVGAVTSDGVTLIFPGEETASDKVYKVNNGVTIKAGDRVKVFQDSGTYIVEYVIGTPNARVPWGLPSDGEVNQILRRTSRGAAWSNETKELPSDGSSGQVLKKTSSGVAWGTDETGLPSGGSSGQYLTKTSSGTAWADGPSGVPSGGSSGQVLTKNSSGYGWAAAPTPTQIKNNSYYVSMGSYGSLEIKCSYLGFFGASPVSRPSVSSSADVSTVISALKKLGLFS